jgi:4-hydroxy-tetrahydrodipicolinate synthase
MGSVEILRAGGLFIPQVTPFQQDGRIDEASLERLTRHFLGQEGVSGIVSCARIGEGPVLTWEEQCAVFRAVQSVMDGAHAHIAAIGPRSTAEAVAQIRELERIGVTAAMIFPPLLFAWGQVPGELKVRFFRDLNEQTKLPLVLFQIPVRNYWYDVETVARISRLSNVAAMKEASFDREQFAQTAGRLRAEGADMTLLTGNDRFVGECLEQGARGMLLGVTNLATGEWARMMALARAGDLAGVRATEAHLRPLQEVIFGEPIVEAVSRIKTALRHEGIIAHAGVRAPQMGISAAEEKDLLRRYEAVRAAAVAR